LFDDGIKKIPFLSPPPAAEGWHLTQGRLEQVAAPILHRGLLIINLFN